MMQSTVIPGLLQCLALATYYFQRLADQNMALVVMVASLWGDKQYQLYYFLLALVILLDTSTRNVTYSYDLKYFKGLYIGHYLTFIIVNNVKWYLAYWLYKESIAAPYLSMLLFVHGLISITFAMVVYPILKCFLSEERILYYRFARRMMERLDRYDYSKERIEN